MIIYVYWLSLHFGAWTTGRPHAVHAARDQSTLRWDGTSGGLCCHGRCHTDRSCSPGTSQPGQQGWWVSLGFQWFPDWFSRKIAFWVRKRIKTNWEPQEARLHPGISTEVQLWHALAATSLPNLSTDRSRGRPIQPKFNWMNMWFGGGSFPLSQEHELIAFFASLRRVSSQLPSGNYMYNLH